MRAAAALRRDMYARLILIFLLALSSVRPLAAHKRDGDSSPSSRAKPKGRKGPQHADVSKKALMKGPNPECSPASQPLSTCSPFWRSGQSEASCEPRSELSPLAALALRPYHIEAEPTKFLWWVWSGCCGLGNSLGAIYGARPAIELWTLWQFRCILLTPFFAPCSRPSV